MSRRARALAAGPLLLATACALQAPPAEATLRDAAAAAPEDAAAAPPWLAAAVAAQRELDALVATALAAAQRPGASPAAQLAAAALLFQAADLRLQRATLAGLAESPGPADLAAVLGAEDRVGDADRTAILSLCQTGQQLAEAVLAVRPDDPAARLQRAQHLGLVAWANGATRALLAGLGPRLAQAIDAALVGDPEREAAAPLRLQGRFRSQAPWPYADRPLAVVALRRAAAAAPVPVNWLFLGDALLADGDRDGARLAWQKVAAAAPDAATRWSADLLRELARRRLAAQ